jgi:hypothetical protein
MTKTEAIALMNTFITDLGYDPAEVQTVQLATQQPSINLFLVHTDTETGQVTNRSEQITWNQLQSMQLAVAEEVE